MRVGEAVEKPSSRASLADETPRHVTLDDDGRIPFRIRIGVTGDREIEVDRQQVVYQALDRVYDRLLGIPGYHLTKRH